jgi:hypothetical protein
MCKAGLKVYHYILDVHGRLHAPGNATLAVVALFFHVLLVLWVISPFLLQR